MKAWYEFEVPGDPVGQGDLKLNPHTRRLYHAKKKLVPYRDLVAQVARLQRKGPLRFTKDVPVSLRVHFVVRRPQQPKYEYPVVGDLDKFVRAIGDAITGVLIEDDTQIVEIMARKVYGMNPHTEVVVSRA